MDDKGMNDIEQDRVFDGFCEQLSGAILSFTLLPLLTKAEPRLWVRIRTKLDALKRCREAIDKAIAEIERTDA